jgi:hypothetical protein
MPFTPGKTVRFPKDTCAACPLRARCTTSSSGGVAIHPDEELLSELRARQVTPAGRPRCANASTSSTRWPTSATGKNLFDVRRVAVVHNLHVIARQRPPAGNPTT